MQYGKITPRQYQIEAHQATTKHIRQYDGPAFVDASVGAGKSLLIAMVAHRCQEVNMPMLVLSRQSEIIEQNAEEAWGIGVKNSIFSASAGVKSTAYPVIFGTEGTVARALDKELADYVPSILAIDECVTGDTVISTKFGPMRIDNPALSRTPIRCISEITGEVFFDTPVRVFTNGTKRVSSIKLCSGEELRCTGTHKLFFQGSWVRAKSLRNGDRLTLIDLHSGVLRRLLRASVAVVKKLFQTLLRNQ